ncbi:MAG: 1-deoxy-D-xylulose-5-phosphate synthase, partial [Leptospiraceae bacterium]|nr:1-deoxy-D-xylulose-5-phosphate synthase [Leptospiraceae bacterium]
APATGAELKAFLKYAENYNDGPIAVRFPKAACDPESLEKDVDISSRAPVVSGHGKDVAIVAVGAMWDAALDAERILRNDHGVLATVLGLRWIRPLDQRALIARLEEADHFVFVEDAYVHCSASTSILETLPSHIKAKHMRTFAFPTETIEHGTREEIMDEYELSGPRIAESVKSMLYPEGKIISRAAGSSET